MLTLSLSLFPLLGQVDKTEKEIAQEKCNLEKELAKNKVFRILFVDISLCFLLYLCLLYELILLRRWVIQLITRMWRGEEATEVGAPQIARVTAPAAPAQGCCWAAFKHLVLATESRQPLALVFTQYFSQEVPQWPFGRQRDHC